MITIGRSSENTFIIQDDTVSSNHAVIEVVDGFQALVDLGSSNGTFVNGSRISRHLLEIGDEIKFGESKFVWNGFEIRERSEPFPLLKSPNGPESPMRLSEWKWVVSRPLVWSFFTFGVLVLVTTLFFVRNNGSLLISADELAKRTVYVEMYNSDDEACWSGSGAVVLYGTYVITNEHVAMPDDTDPDSTDCTRLRIGIVEKSSAEPTKFFAASVVQSSKSYDLALLKMDLKGSEPLIPFVIREEELGLDIPIRVIGFPGIGGGTVTLTNGVTSGIDDSESADFYKISATINHGNSGGPVVDADGNLVAIATAFMPVGIDCVKKDCVADGVGLGLARPIRYAMPFLRNLSK